MCQCVCVCVRERIQHNTANTACNLHKYMHRVNIQNTTHHHHRTTHKNPPTLSGTLIFSSVSRSLSVSLCLALARVSRRARLLHIMYMTTCQKYSHARGKVSQKLKPSHAHTTLCEQERANFFENCCTHTHTLEHTHTCTRATRATHTSLHTPYIYVVGASAGCEGDMLWPARVGWCVRCVKLLCELHGI